MNYQPHNFAAAHPYLASLYLAVAMLLLPVSLVSPAELNIAQNQLPVNLGPYLDYFEELERTYSIQQMTSASIEWQRSTQSIPTMDMNKSAHWFCIVLSGKNMLDEDLVLALDTTTLDRVEF